MPVDGVDVAGDVASAVGADEAKFVAEAGRGTHIPSLALALADSRGSWVWTWKSPSTTSTPGQ